MKDTKRPNLVYVLVDDLGIGDVSCFNPDSKIHTEHIDALAAQGIRFDDCHSTSAVCSPSRYGLLTGRYNWRSRLKSSVLPGLSPHLIENGRMTVADLLRSAGYRTACVGKWHLGMDWSTKEGYELPKTYQDVFSKPQPEDGVDYTKPVTNGPNARGFDYYYGMPASLDQPPFVHMENDRVVTPPDHMVGMKGFNHADPELNTTLEYGPAEPGFDPRNIVPEMDNKVLELLDEFAKDDQPFFLYYPTLAVHGPLVPTEEYEGRSGLGLYGDFVLQLDGFIGRLTRKLDETGLAENTILIFTSDNGCSTVADYPKLHAFGHHPSYIYRGTKGDIWDGGHRIPFVLRWPGHAPANTVCSQTSCLVDLMATLSELLGIALPDSAGEDSCSELALWQGGDEPVREYTVHHSLLGNFSIRKDQWKLEMCAGSGSFNPPVEGKDTAGMPPVQLYNMEEDPGETTNLCDAHPELVAQLREKLVDYILSGRSTPGAPQENVPCENWPGLEWFASARG